MSRGHDDNKMKSGLMNKRSSMFVICATFFCTSPGAAKITRITSRTALAANANFDWRRFGKDGTTLSTPLSRQDGNLKITLGASSGTLMSVILQIKFATLARCLSPLRKGPLLFPAAE